VGMHARSRPGRSRGCGPLSAGTAGGRRRALPAVEDRSLRSTTVRTRVRHSLEYLVVLGVRRVLRALPLSVALGLGEALGGLLFSVVRMRRKVALRNLAIAFPDLAPRRRERIAASSYRHMGLVFAEFGCMDRWAGRGVRFANLSLLRKLQSEGNGVVVVTGHFGNWEALAAGTALSGVPLSGVGRPQKNRRITTLIDGIREGCGLEMVTTSVGGVRAALKRLRQGRVVLFLADQDAGRRGVFVDFLGRQASTTPIPVALAKRVGAALVPGYIYRLGRAKHVVVFEDPLPLDAETDPLQLVASSLARQVRARPELYFWVHRRWKTQPGAVPTRSLEKPPQ
jgi:KDO2-lipid IV(A) lauroyltransferase